MKTPFKIGIIFPENKAIPAKIEQNDAMQTAAAAISFDISTNFEYLFLKTESSINSITEFKSSQIKTIAIKMNKMQNSTVENFKKIAKTTARIAIMSCLTKFL